MMSVGSIEDVYCEVDALSTGSAEQFYFFDKKKRKILKLKAVSIKTSSSIIHYYLIFLVHIFPLVYPYSYILKSVQHYVKAF